MNKWDAVKETHEAENDEVPSATKCSNQEAWERTDHSQDKKTCQPEDIDLKYYDYIVKNISDNLCNQKYVFKKVIRKTNIIIILNYSIKEKQKFDFGTTQKSESPPTYRHTV